MKFRKEKISKKMFWIIGAFVFVVLGYFLYRSFVFREGNEDFKETYLNEEATRLAEDSVNFLLKDNPNATQAEQDSTKSRAFTNFRTMLATMPIPTPEQYAETKEKMKANARQTQAQ